MVAAFDYCPERPEHIDTILNGLDRYNPETTTTFQEYVTNQCESQTYDCFANLALLKLYQFNPHLTRDESITNILVKALTIFPSPDFALCLSLLPPYVLAQAKLSQQQNGNALPASSTGTLAEAVQHLSILHTQLNNAQYTAFWNTFESDDLYADLVAEVAGFEDSMRVRIAVVVSQCMQEVQRDVMESWLNVQGSKLDNFVKEVRMEAGRREGAHTAEPGKRGKRDCGEGGCEVPAIRADSEEGVRAAGIRWDAYQENYGSEGHARCEKWLSPRCILLARR
ncbi:hypothetical protein LTR33_002325 [Friedmanniomyces endolithicus]|nr:hypothetical protein LTR33_002325 [Friedmanniomyces endolithicus]